MNLNDFKDFTPGPWEIDGGEIDPSKPNVLPGWTLIRRQVFDTTGMVGAGIVSASEHRFAYLNAGDDTAHLIAAAPELLSECRRLKAENERLKSKLLAISALRGLTLLGPDSHHQMGEVATLYHEQGAAAAFNQAADLADLLETHAD